MWTRTPVPPRPRFRRRKSSWRGGSTAACSARRLAGEGSAEKASPTRLISERSGANSVASSAKNVSLAFASSASYDLSTPAESRAPDTSPRSDSSSRHCSMTRRASLTTSGCAMRDVNEFRMRPNNWPRGEAAGVPGWISFVRVSRLLTRRLLQLVGALYARRRDKGQDRDRKNGLRASFVTPPTLSRALLSNEDDERQVLHQWMTPAGGADHLPQLGKPLKAFGGLRVICLWSLPSAF